MILSELTEIIDRLEQDMQSKNLLGMCVVSIHHHGKISIQYSDYMASHSAQTVGYLNVLCQELTDITGKS